MRKTAKIVYTAITVSVALILSYVETLIPINFGIPGIKIGLANVVTVTVLYLFGKKSAVCVCALRIILSSLLFGTMLSFIYSASGAAFSLLGMILLKKTGKFGTVGVSAAGGILHNMGQLVAAVLVTQTPKIAYYIPVLVISGTLTGVFIGMISSLLIQRLPKSAKFICLDKK